MTDETPKTPSDDPHAPYIEWETFMDTATEQPCLRGREDEECDCPACVLFFWWCHMEGLDKGNLYAAMCAAIK
jgi:hypothetical protein